MTELPKLPLTMEQAELAIDGITGRIVALSAIQRALIENVIATAPAAVDQLRTRLMLQAADSQDELQHETESCRQQFLQEVASANRLIDMLQAAQGRT